MILSFLMAVLILLAVLGIMSFILLLVVDPNPNPFIMYTIIVCYNCHRYIVNKLSNIKKYLFCCNHTTAGGGDFLKNDNPTLAKYDDVTDMYRVNYILNGVHYSMIIPSRLLKYRRRYRYTDNEGNYSNLDRFAGPLENFHGVPMTLRDLNLHKSEIHRLDIDEPTKQPVVIKPDDILFTI
ncbi:hypothetical protein [Trichoplusia ni ascovirus 2c]|uniref:hypothetical protein n=1 Tax=Trichoplusia ni ascovirus 2c TaxID=328615 RepID=UPI0000E44233|nr:hypothetical protein TNAV2c_gp091 [Trichoplusia ni ascovirus 2c]ABF70608.1 hypothetical protein [Trichoplusia ni ascovirus 2c]AUS94197.1 hypothetical protein [Trichoplusia ni ascovirus 6b]